MKYGCCTNMLPREQGSIGEEYLPMLAKLGYDYVELPLGDLTTILTAAQKSELKKLLEDSLPVYACNNFFTNDIRLCGPGATALETVTDYIKRALATAAEFGVKITVFGSPWAKFCPKDFSRDRAFDQLVRICRIMGAEAEQYGITVAIEPNNTLETNMINTYSDVLELVRVAGHPNVKGLQDYFHMRQERQTVAAMLEGAEYLAHTHFACFEGRRFPRDISEDSGYATYFKTLHDIGYNGGISMEGFLDKKEDFRRDAAETLKFFKLFESGK